MTDLEKIKRVYDDLAYPDYLKTVLSYTKTKDGRKEKVFDFDTDAKKLYVVGDEVREDFVNSEGRKMYRYFRYGKYNCDGKYKEGAQIRGDFEVLIYGARFVE